MSRNVCVVSGSRADFGFLLGPMRLIDAHPSMVLQTLVTGSHLCPAFGNTQSEVEAAGFAIDARVDMVLAGDSSVAITKAVGLGVIGFADALARLRPDMLVLLGDRYETFAAATAATLAKVPIAHLAGGDVTEGAFDEQLRHAITKMSHLHFVTHADAHDRVVQMGEDPSRVFLVGSTSLDQIRRMPRRSPGEVFEEVGLAPRSRNLLVTFHPATLDDREGVASLRELLAALGSMLDTGIVLAGSNADTDGASMNRELAAFAASREHVVFRPSFARETFLGLLGAVDAVVGNSSSGLYEAPSFGIPTINIGDRQRGRLRASSVVDCPCDAGAIVAAIRAGLAMDCRRVTNPYGDGKASERIVAAIGDIDDPRALLKKRFVTLQASHAAAA